MSNRLNVNKSKKDRPKSSDKFRKGKRESSPDKPGTPSGDLQEEGSQQVERPVISNEEILKLIINEEDLKKVHLPTPPPVQKSDYSQIVRKQHPESKWNQPKPKRVIIQRAAPPEAQLKPFDFADGSGARYDRYGNIIPYSILGTIEDYKTYAFKTGQIPEELATVRDIEKGGCLSVKYEKRPPSAKHPLMQSVEESNALKHWQAKMKERRRQQDYLGKLLKKSPNELVMNEADNYRKIQEQRYIIDRTISKIDYGKGYRIGSEFWKQQEPIGDDNTGMHMTLTQTEQGYPPPIEQIVVPKVVQAEKGTGGVERCSGLGSRWENSFYQRERSTQLQPVINELVPHRGNLENVAIVGHQKNMIRYNIDGSQSSRTLGSAGSIRQGSADILLLPDPKGNETEKENFDPLEGHPDVRPSPVFGPSLLFGGQRARWTGDSTMYKGQLGFEGRVIFEGSPNQRVTSFLDLTNDGTTTIYYDWKKLSKENPFEVRNTNIQRFYFNTSSGTLLPGDTLKFPFIFKSENPGVFTERWQLETKPVLCGGAKLQVTLRGVATPEDKYKHQRCQLEKELENRQAHQIVNNILDFILSGIQTPNWPSSPVDAYLSEEEHFHRKNPSLYYQTAVVDKMHGLFNSLQMNDDDIKDEDLQNDDDADVTEPDVWDMSVDTLSKLIMDLDEMDERKQEYFQLLNSYIITLSFPPFTSIQQQKINIGYDMFCNTVDCIVYNIGNIREVLRMPEREPDDIPEDTINPFKIKKQTVMSNSDPLSLSQSDNIRRTNSNETIKPNSASRNSSSGDAKRAGPGKSPSKPDQKEKKSAKDSKMAAKNLGKETPKTGGKITPATAASKRPPSTRGIGSAGSQPLSSPALPVVDPILDAKYKEKIYTQTYSLLSDMVDNMITMFKDLEERKEDKNELL